MKDEIVDIVDENNRDLYKTTKEEAHKKGLLQIIDTLLKKK